MLFHFVCKILQCFAIIYFRFCMYPFFIKTSIPTCLPHPISTSYCLFASSLHFVILFRPNFYRSIRYLLLLFFPPTAVHIFEYLDSKKSSFKKYILISGVRELPEMYHEPFTACATPPASPMNDQQVSHGSWSQTLFLTCDRALDVGGNLHLVSLTWISQTNSTYVRHSVSVYFIVSNALKVYSTFCKSQ